VEDYDLTQGDDEATGESWADGLRYDVGGYHEWISEVDDGREIPLLSSTAVGPGTESDES